MATEQDPRPFQVGDTVDYIDSDEGNPGTYRGVIIDQTNDEQSWLVDLFNGGEEAALPSELTLVRHAGDDEAPDCTRCGHFYSRHDVVTGCAGLCQCPRYTGPAASTPRAFLDLPTGGILPPVLAAGEDLQAGDPVRLAPEYDVVEKAEHYNRHPSGIEAIQVVRHMSFNMGSAIKYLWRADLKGNALEDLKKARYYINDEIAKRERQAAAE